MCDVFLILLTYTDWNFPSIFGKYYSVDGIWPPLKLVQACKTITGFVFIYRIINRWRTLRRNISVSIGQEQVSLRPLISKQQRLILSNVALPIPHAVIEKIIDDLNIKRLAPITVLKATISHEGYNHVLSLRRQTYIKP